MNFLKQIKWGRVWITLSKFSFLGSGLYIIIYGTTTQAEKFEKLAPWLLVGIGILIGAIKIEKILALWQGKSNVVETTIMPDKPEAIAGKEK